MRCDYRCDNGWLVVDGVDDSYLDGDVVVHLLLPTEYTACFRCNDAAFTNGDITCGTI